MTSNYAHRRRLIRLMQRKEDLELREVLQTLAERLSKLGEAQTLSRTTQSEYEEAAFAARSTLSAGAELDTAIQSVAARSLVDRCRLLSERQQSVDRQSETVDLIHKDVAFRRARIRKLERADEQAAIGELQLAAILQANESDAIWLGAHRTSTAP